MAVSILLVVVVSVTGAITAGQQRAFEAHQRIGGTLVAEAMLARLLTEDYGALAGFNGYTEPVGAMVDSSGQPLPENLAMLGRDVQVTTSVENLTALGIEVAGRTVRVRAFNADDRTLAEASRFIPEPQP